MEKVTFSEWLHNEEPDFHESTEKALEWFRKLINVPIHVGDCTKMPSTCCLCLAESLLKEYREYFLEINKQNQ